MQKLKSISVKKTSFIACIGVSFILLLLYSLVNHMSLDRLVFIPSDLDMSIPYMSWTYIVYVSAFIQSAYVILQIPQNRFLYYMLAPFVALIVGLVFFTILPVEYPRYMYPDDNLWVHLFRFLDAPGNCFPSLHVAMTILFAYIYTDIKILESSFIKSKVYSIKIMTMWIWTIAVIVSVLTTKQHYIVDVLGGIALALICIIFKKKINIISG